MKRQMQNANKLYFRKIFEEGEIKFGEIFLEVDDEILSLNELLVTEGYAEKCSDFEESKS